MLKFLFIDQRSHQSWALSIFEEWCEKSPNSVLLFNIIWKAFLRSQSFFQVFFWANCLSLCIYELQCKISYNPEETWEVLGKIFRILIFRMCINLNVFGEVDDQTQVLNGILIDWADWVIDEDRWTQNCQGKYFKVVILIFIKSSYSFRIDDKDVNFFSILSGSLKWTAPAP